MSPWIKKNGADKKRQLYNAGIKCTYYCFNGPKPPKAEDGGTSGK